MNDAAPSGETTPVVILHVADPGPAVERLRETHPALEVLTCDSYAGLPALLERTGAEVVFSERFDGTDRFPRAALLDAPTVRWVSVAGSGTDHLAPWDRTRLTVTNAAGVAADTMAEYVLGTLLSFTLDLHRFGRAQARREWIAGRVEPVAGRTVLILGLGHTGRAVARRMRALGLTTLGVRARPRPTACVDEVHGIEALPSLWERADVVVCAVPLTPSTRALVDGRAFRAMRPGTILIDVSRGGVIEEAAMLEALRDGPLRAAARDVFDTEPLPPGHPAWDADNLLITPHCSSVYDGWQLASVAMFSDNLARYRRGEALENIVDPERGY